ncbi:MAG: hypothetical protein WC087_02985 [Candidatus Paceibacterota bacterium]
MTQNAFNFVKSLESNYGSMADFVSRGVNTQKYLNPEQQLIVEEMFTATKTKIDYDRIVDYELSLLLMQLIIFVNTL